MKPGLNVIQQAQELRPAHRPVCAALGMFDGVHLGHQQVLRQTVANARRLDGVPVAVTFDQHPNAVVAPSRNPPLIYSLGQRLQVMASVGIETILLLHFDRSFSQQSGEAFAYSLQLGFGQLASISVGTGFTFGHKRSGNVELLRTLGAKHGFAVEALDPITCHGKVISSTRIREAIHQGKLELVDEMLGRPYGLAGTVLHGEELGRKLGFPTANIDIAGLAVPPTGVYAGLAKVSGATWPAVANIGYRPTLNQAKPPLRFEVHILDFAGELYGQELEFTFRQRLRGERQFGSLEALKAQIAADVTAAQELSD